MTFKHQVNHIVKEANKKFYTTKFFGIRLNLSTVLKLYTTYILPKLEYSNLCFYTTKTQTKLEFLNI